LAKIMRIDVWSDVVCPWCAVGLANLDAALATTELAEPVEVVLHSFQLDPGAPRIDDEPVLDRLVRKYGVPPAQIRASQARLVELGTERGIDFRFDDAIGGNTFDAHRLLHLAHLRGCQRELKQRLFRAYFTDGEPIGDPSTLRRAATDVGLDEHEVDAVLAGDAFAQEVRSDIAEAQRMGISGVPFFVVDGRYGLSGAQPPEAIASVIGDAQADTCGPDGCEI
jgi:predicted DsbA family dithiol-disulfide isomerase